jgi:hypothetical protein
VIVATARETATAGPRTVPVRKGVWTFCRLKARHVTAWGEAHGAKPQVKSPNISSSPCKGGTLVRNECSVPALQASGINQFRGSRAFACDARSSPGCHIAGFQPASETGKMSKLQGASLGLTHVQTPATAKCLTLRLPSLSRSASMEQTNKLRYGITREDY